MANLHMRAAMRVANRKGGKMQHFIILSELFKNLKEIFKYEHFMLNFIRLLEIQIQHWRNSEQNGN